MNLKRQSVNMHKIPQDTDQRKAVMNGNEPLGFIKSTGFLDLLSNYSLLRRTSTVLVVVGIVRIRNI
jgi:hypothetical protein